MIPNAGLDNIAAYNVWGNTFNTSLTGSQPDNNGTQWLAYAAISEDSQEPLATDTNIGAERARTNSTGGFARAATAIRDPNTNRVGLSIERAYVFNVTDAWNITKYGYVPVSSGGNFSWIDLTRSDPNDPQSQPITLTLQAGDQLQLWCTTTITVPWSVDLESFVITGAPGNDSVGTHDAYCGFYAVNDSLSINEATPNESSIATLIKFLFWPTNTREFVATPNPPNASRDEQLSSSSGNAHGSEAVLEAYTSGAYYRDKNYKFSTSEGNITMTGIDLRAGRSSQYGHGFKIVFSDPATFTKTSTHELTLTFRVSWQEG